MTEKTPIESLAHLEDCMNKGLDIYGPSGLKVIIDIIPLSRVIELINQGYLHSIDNEQKDQDNA